MWKKVLLLIIFSSFFLNCFNSENPKINNNPPDYIKELVAYKEGYDRLEIYFILADNYGDMTAQSGVAILTIYLKESGYMYFNKKIYNKNFTISYYDFYKTRAGRGSFEHEVILYSFGQIKYSYFNHAPKDTETGKIELIFQTIDGRELKAEETIFF